MTSGYDCRPSDLCDWCIEQLRKEAEVGQRRTRRRTRSGREQGGARMNGNRHPDWCTAHEPCAYHGRLIDAAEFPDIDHDRADELADREDNRREY